MSFMSRQECSLTQNYLDRPETKQESTNSRDYVGNSDPDDEVLLVSYLMFRLAKRPRSLFLCHENVYQISGRRWSPVVQEKSVKPISTHLG